MRLQRIYSSKLYVTSTRKDRIHAAMQDPINMELVQQLEDYLSDDAKMELQQAERSNEMSEAAAPNVPDASDAGSGSLPGRSHSGRSSAPSPSGFTGDIMSDFGDDDLADIDPIDDGGEAPAEVSEVPEAPEAVESVTQEGKPITSSTAIVWTTLNDVSSECDTIMGTLNSREDTKGVNRLEVKDSELWIYYNDDSNLNDKMIEVISVLNSTGYTYLKFNRLARSNNAIVFDINLSTAEPIKPTKDLEQDN